MNKPMKEYKYWFRGDCECDCEEMWAFCMCRSTYQPTITSNSNEDIESRIYE